MSNDSQASPSSEENIMSQEELSENQNTENISVESEVIVEDDQDSVKIEELQQQLKEEQDKGLRAQAEMINFRKRQEKERSSWNQMAVKDVISAFLEPLDNLERTVEAATQGESDERTQSLAKGVQMVIQQINDILERKNVVTIDPKGETFNPNEHEAYGQIETDEVEEGKVFMVFRKGYKIGDQLVRTATVQIAKKPASN